MRLFIRTKQFLVNHLQTHRDNQVLAGFIVLIVVLLAVLVVRIQYLSEEKNVAVDAESNYLYVTDFSPFGQVRSPKEITITFNHPVDHHLLEHHFSISPETKGTLKREKDGLVYKFVPQDGFDSNTYYSVMISAGLISENRKTLLDTYTGNFNVKPLDETIVFMKDGINGKVLPFASNKSAKVKINKPDSSEEFTVSFYNSTPAQLLNYLLYKKDSSDQMKFASKSIAHDKSQLIRTMKVVKTETEEDLGSKPGIYYLEARDKKGELAGSTFVLINSKGVVLRQDDQKVVLAGFDAVTGQKINDNIEATLYNLEESPRQIGATTFNGIQTGYNLPFSQRLDVVMATLGGETILIPVKLPLSMADINVYSDLDQENQIFLYTERPIYKPGDTVFYRGIIRQDSDALYKLPAAGRTVYVWLPTRSDPVEMTATTNQNGTFSGNFVVPKDFEGSYGLQASLEPDPEKRQSYRTYASFDVMKYTKPEFELVVEGSNQEYLRNEKPKFTISGKYFNGKPMSGQEVEYTPYTMDYYEIEKAVYNKNFTITQQGGMCGGGNPYDYYGTELQKPQKIKLDSNGKAVIEVPVDLKPPFSQTVTVVAQKKDKSGNEIISAAKAIRHAANFNIFYIPAANNYKVGEELVAPFYAEELSGKKVSDKEFTYRLAKISYDSDVEKNVVSGKTTTDGSGKGIVKFKIPDTVPVDSYYLIVEAQDSSGNVSQARKYISLQKQDATEDVYWSTRGVDQTYLNISSSQNAFVVGDTVVFSVHSPKELDVLLTQERGRVYQPQIIHLNKGSNTISLPITTDLSPSITSVFSFFADGQYYTEGLTLNVPAMHKLLQMSITPDKQQYKPGETALLKITTRDSNGNPVPTNFSVGVVDKAIYALRKNATPAIHSAFYFFRPRRTNASSSLTLVGSYGPDGRGGGGGGGLSFNKLVDTLYWDPNASTDASGEVTVAVPLGNTETIWKAQILGGTNASDFGQADTEFLVTQ